MDRTGRGAGRSTVVAAVERRDTRGSGSSVEPAGRSGRGSAAACPAHSRCRAHDHRATRAARVDDRHPGLAAAACDAGRHGWRDATDPPGAIRRRAAGPTEHRVGSGRRQQPPRRRCRASRRSVARQRPDPPRPRDQRTSRPRRAAGPAVLDRRPRQHQRHARERRADSGERAEPRRPHHNRSERSQLRDRRGVAGCG